MNEKIVLRIYEFGTFKIIKRGQNEKLFFLINNLNLDNVNSYIKSFNVDRDDNNIIEQNEQKSKKW